MTNIMVLSNSKNTSSVIITSLIFYLISAILAGLTILTHISQILKISFKLYFVIAVGICIVIIGFWSLALIKSIAKIAFWDKKILLFLLGIGLTGSIIALITMKPNIDDFYYVPNVIYYIQNPNALMGYKNSLFI